MSYSPTLPLGEHYVVIVFGCSLYKCHTGVILPVSHCLLEQRLVGAWEKINYHRNSKQIAEENEERERVSKTRILFKNRNLV